MIHLTQFVNNSGNTGTRINYESGRVNSQSFVGKVLLQIKCNFELN